MGWREPLEASRSGPTRSNQHQSRVARALSSCILSILNDDFTTSLLQCLTLLTVRERKRKKLLLIYSTSLHLTRTSCVPIGVCTPLSYHHAPLRTDGIHLFYTLPPGSKGSSKMSPQLSLTAEQTQVSQPLLIHYLPVPQKLQLLVAGLILPLDIIRAWRISRRPLHSWALPSVSWQRYTGFVISDVDICKIEDSNVSKLFSETDNTVSRQKYSCSYLQNVLRDSWHSMWWYGGWRSMSSGIVRACYCWYFILSFVSSTSSPTYS